MESDVVIAGGGHVGLSLALALGAAMPSLTVTLVDAAPPEAATRDTRASAIAAAGRRMLMRLGVWDEMKPDAEAITEMVITDSRTGDAVRPVFLTFGGKVEDGQPFAHMVMNASMIGALRRGAEAAGARLVAPQTVRDFTVGASAVTVELGNGDRIRARLLVAADGVRSRLRALAGISTVGWSYGQSGIVVTVAHERPHHGRAIEHFLPGGPFAMLPLPDNRSSLVWTERTETADRLVKGDADVFQYELERRFGHQLGAIHPVGRPRAFPLGLTLARSFVKPRFALCGDAAHGIHPIAGQGLNLGYRDVAALAETIVEAERLGLDIGSLAVLERYQSWRRFDTVEMGATTDILNRLFSNDNPVLRFGRDVGLGLVDRLPALKKMFIGQAAGNGGDLPRLLRGEAI
ncbi:ubiquinone biosynthesis hydroxylase [Bauldia sp.]|uniref:ubiquinone biosynthesis hydroxylase n=1 Tax=Bauldia sp. TaxID=2575872 RepID=UPI0025C72AAF|nr:ubiquinone biosynthesis hydroxylase [Bauldia sp.]